MCYDEYDTQTDTWSGRMGVDILQFLLIVKRFNVSYSMHWAGDQWGSLDVNGSWNGIIGMLTDGTADLCPCQLTVTSRRAVDVDYGKLKRPLYSGFVWLQTGKYRPPECIFELICKL